MNRILFILYFSFIFSFSNSGYFESNIDIFSTDEIHYIGYNKIRYDLLKDVSDEISFNCSVVGKNNYGKNSYDINNYLPNTNSNLFDEFPAVSINDSIYFDQLYFTYKQDDYKFLIGRQPVYFGSGYIWNPVNNISYKNSIDPTYEISGLNVIRMHYFSSFGDYDIIFFPENDGKEVSIYSSFGTTFFNQSVRLYVSRFLSKSINIDNESIDLMTLEDKTRYSLDNAIGISQSGTILFDIGMWTELYSNLDTKMNDWVIGFDYTFDSGIYIMIERYHQDLNHHYNETYNDETILNYFSGNIQSIGQDYSFISFGIYMDEYTRISLQSISNISDDSSILFPQLDYNLMDDIDLSLSLYIFNGDHTTEFGKNNWGAKTRILIYF